MKTGRPGEVKQHMKAGSSRVEGPGPSTGSFDSRPSDLSADHSASAGAHVLSGGAVHAPPTTGLVSEVRLLCLLQLTQGVVDAMVGDSLTSCFPYTDGRHI